MSEKSHGASRILIAASSFADAQAALSQIAPLMDIFSGEIAGLLSRVDAAEMAVFSGQHIVSERGTLLSVPSSKDARTLAEGDARAFRQQLARVAECHRRRWTFDFTTGELLARVLGEMQRDDVLVLGHRPLSRQGGRVFLIRSDAEGAETSRAVAEALAHASGTLVSEIVANRPKEVQRSLSRLDRSLATAVVADFNAGPLQGEADLRRLLSAARCPVAVLGAAAILRASRRSEETRSVEV